MEKEWKEGREGEGEKIAFGTKKVPTSTAQPASTWLSYKMAEGFEGVRTQLFMSLLGSWTASVHCWPESLDCKCSSNHPKFWCGQVHEENWRAYLSSHPEPSTNYKPYKWGHFRPRATLVPTPTFKNHAVNPQDHEQAERVVCKPLSSGYVDIH